MGTDTELLRDRVTIVGLLAQFGHDVRNRSRSDCPLCGSQNVTAFSFSDKLFQCFVCGAGGDVFDLAKAVYRVDFPQAVEIVAKIAGFGTGAPRLSNRDAERRTKIARRRKALREWRDNRLNKLATEIGNLSREADFIVNEVKQARDQENPDGFGWLLLESVYADLAVAEWLSAQLESDDESEWARQWLSERRAEVEKGVPCNRT